MMQNLSSLAACAAVVCLLSAAKGQKPTSTPGRSIAEHTAVVGGGDLVPIHTADPDNGSDYGVWATGDRYKVSFHGDMTFVPYLGLEYPSNQPFSWRTESVTAGGAELLTGQEPGREHTDYRFEYQYGAVTEAYDVRVDGLEQTFVIHSMPSTAGDIVVRGALATSLVTPPVEAAHAARAVHGALDFVDNNGDDILRYGEAFVFDAAGRKSPITSAYRGGKIELTVPATWLRDATWPVTIDPVLSVTNVSGGNRHFSVDVTRDDDGNDVMMCYAKGASAADQDAFGAIMTDTFTGRVTVFTDVTTAWSTLDTNCATTGSPRRYGIAMTRVFTSGSGIRIHARASGDLSLQTGVVSVTNTANTYDSRPDIGGAEPGSTFSPTGNNFLIVWQRDAGSAATNVSSIWARRYGTGLTPFGNEFPISVNGTFASDHEYPALNQQSIRVGSAVGKTTWMVVYQKYTTQTWTVEGKLVSDDDVVEPGYNVGDTANHRVYPKVAGRAGRYLVAFPLMPFNLINFKTPSIAGHSLITQRVNWNSGGSPAPAPEKTLDGPYNERRLLLGGLAYDSNTQSHWALTSGSYRAVGGTGRTIVIRLGYNGLLLESQTLQLPPTATDQGFPGGIAFNDDANEFLASWTMGDATTGGAWAARFTYPTVATPAVSGISCSTATPGWSGSQQIGSEFPRMTLAGAVPGMFAWLVVGTSAINTNLAPQGMPGCALLVPASGAGHLGVLTAVSSSTGTASLPLALPEFLPNFSIYLQWFHIQPGTNPLGLVSTQRLQVDLVK